MEDSTTPDERAKLLAVCWLDGVGEEWQRLAAEVHNVGLRILQAAGVTIPTEDWKTADKMETRRHLNPDEQAEPAVDWAAAEADLKRLAGF